MINKIEKLTYKDIKYDDIKDYQLGAIYSKEKTIFRVFAPERKVALSLSKDYKNPRKEIYEMEKNNLGVWELSLNGDFNGYYYSYIVDGKYEVTDPYSFTSSINSMYSVVIDMDQTNPQGFKNSKLPTIAEDEAIIYEMNVKNYTADQTSGVINRGKYLGLTEENTSYHGFKTGIDNLEELGITHVQLLPIYDFISVDESTDRFFDDDNYNWGYDPELYFAPEGSYSTDPNDPKARIVELKKMVDAIHKKNIAVIMDVVYNHTFKSYDSNLNTLGPNYYYRMNEDGTFSNGSGVGNELASERPFVRKLIIDSLKHWVREYKIDGFRFDLMALIDIDTIKLALKELSKINPNLIIHGEPWMALSTTLPYDKHTVKGSQRSNGFGVFNDIYRDAIKGDTDSYGIGYIQGDYRLKTLIEEGIAGSINYDERHKGFCDYASETINYFNCHDNLILYDKLQISIQDLAKIDDYVKLAVGLIMLSFGKPFLYEGNEFNHSKKNDRNSYNSPLFINAINWKEKQDNQSIFTYTKDIIALRKDIKVFNESNPDKIREKLSFMDELEDSLIIYKIKYNNSYILVAINVSDSVKSIEKDKLNDFLSYKNPQIDKIFGKEGKDNNRLEYLDIEERSINVYKIGE
ncbi:type I pullulanase [uncultured Anaerococcus sp.]|uniref:type I pullulanase n=1 Tax=uncultured Anaerococcus sp. TaxID=293428 RepID=UPI00343C07D3